MSTKMFHLSTCHYSSYHVQKEYLLSKHSRITICSKSNSFHSFNIILVQSFTLHIKLIEEKMQKLIIILNLNSILSLIWERYAKIGSVIHLFSKFMMPICELIRPI